MEFHEVANLFPLMIGDDYRALVADIQDNGLKQPITIYEGKILDGRNRYVACLELGIEPDYQEWDRIGSPISYVISLNLNRRHLTSSQRAVIALDAERLYAEEAKENMRTGGKGSQIFDYPIGKAAERAAVDMQTNRQYVADAKRIEKDAPELLEKVKTGEMTIPQARSTIRRQEQTENAQALASPNLPDRKYSVICADPPWRYDFSFTTNREIENQYPTMTIDEICALDIPALCAEDCVLFLWATNPKLKDAMKVLLEWGFEYKTNMVWVKDKIGMGYYARQRHELILIATRGNLSVPLPENRPDSVIEYPRQEHSEKPDIFYEKVEVMYPGIPKVELFARTKREGWDVWGNQV